MQWYETVYSRPVDPPGVSAQDVLADVDYIGEVLEGNKNRKILDVGCGTGRHVTGLAARGYDVTGIDLSESMLKQAKTRAKQEAVVARFLKKDARYFQMKNSFDLVLMLYGGAFGLMETDEMNARILRNAFNALKPGGILLMTVSNALEPLVSGSGWPRWLSPAETMPGEVSFDPLTFRRSALAGVPESPAEPLQRLSERCYAPAEILGLLRGTGFKGAEVTGVLPGRLGAGSPLLPQDPLMLIMARR